MSVSLSAERPHLAFILLREVKLPLAEHVLTAFRQLAPPQEHLLEIDPHRHPAEDVADLHFGVPKGGSLLVGLMPMPVPGHEADDAFAFSYSAGLRPGTLERHCAHLVVFFHDAPGRPRYEGLTRFTYLVAAVARVSPACAIYWGDAGATHEAQFFIERAQQRDPDLMLPLWCGFHLAPDGAMRASVVTLGMRRQLGIMDLHVTAPRKNLAEYVGATFDILAYAARRGSAVPEGDTVGWTADERLPVRYEPSPLDASVSVWRVDFP